MDNLYTSLIHEEEPILLDGIIDIRVLSKPPQRAFDPSVSIFDRHAYSEEIIKNFIKVVNLLRAGSIFTEFLICPDRYKEEYLVKFQEYVVNFLNDIGRRNENWICTVKRITSGDNDSGKVYLRVRVVRTKKSEPDLREL